MKKLFLLAAFIGSSMPVAASVTEQAVLAHYADMAHAKYEDSLTTAHALQASVDKLVDEPTEENLAAAKGAWKEARIPYQQTEVYRFGEESDENPYYGANVIANETIVLSGRNIDTKDITKELLSDTLHEVDEIEANVATGYHAIEFLLWGQDLNGTGSGAGKRPATDYDPDNCTGGNCERMKLGLMLHDPEEEHDCFSDKTHLSHYYDVLGTKNVYIGTYTRVDGSELKGPAVSDLVAAQDEVTDKAVRESLDGTLERMQVLVDSAEKDGVAYDQLIASDNAEGNAKVQAAIDALLKQTKAIEKAVASLEISPIAFEGSDSLDAPEQIQ